MSAERRHLGARMLIVSGGILLSRLLGLTRDVAFAHTWGTGLALAAFVIAYRIPNLLRALFGEGAFSAAFVPVFTEQIEQSGRTAAWEKACRVISSLAVVVSVLVLIVIGIGFLMRPLFEGDLAALSLKLFPWLMPFAILICLAAAFAAVLNSLNRFAVPALSQGLLNVLFIAAALVVAPLVSDDPRLQVYALVGAVLVAGTMQLGLHLVAARRAGCAFSWQPRFNDPTVRRVGSLMAPVILGTGVVQLNIVVDTFLAAYLGSTATTSLYYSQRLAYLPVGLFGVAMGTVCLPAMSRAAANKDVDALLRNLRFSLRFVFFLALPAAATMYVLRKPVVRLLFEWGDFGAESTAQTVWALLFYLPGIPAFVWAKIAVAPFYAQQDTRTPVKVAVFCLVLNVVLNIVLMQYLAQGGLALATSVCSYVNVVLLISILRSRTGGLGALRLISGLAKTVAAAACAAVAAGFVADLYQADTAETVLQRLGGVFLPLGAAGIVYLLVASALGCPEIGTATAIFLSGDRRE